MNVYKIVLHIHRLRQMTRVALTKNMADTRVSSRELAYAYQKFVTEISRSETSGTIYNLCSRDECADVKSKYFGGLSKVLYN